MSTIPPPNLVYECDEDEVIQAPEMQNKTQKDVSDDDGEELASPFEI